MIAFMLGALFGILGFILAVNVLAVIQERRETPERKQLREDLEATRARVDAYSKKRMGRFRQGGDFPQ